MKNCKAMALKVCFISEKGKEVNDIRFLDADDADGADGADFKG